MNAGNDFRVIFMGTPQFAVPSLIKLNQEGINICSVITVPDKPSGRGLKLTPSPVKIAAQELGLNILQPEKLKDSGFIDKLKKLNPDLGVVVAFRMLPEAVFNLPAKGTINLHASLLPKYRGAAPINWAIINGEKETGVTTFQLQQKIDTGRIYLQQKISISREDNAGTLHDKLMEAGAELLLKSVKAVRDNNIQPIPQPEGDFPLAPRIFPEDCKIDFNSDAKKLYNFVRGLSPYPGSWTLMDGKRIKILEA